MTKPVFADQNVVFQQVHKLGLKSGIEFAGLVDQDRAMLSPNEPVHQFVTEYLLGDGIAVDLFKWTRRIRAVQMNNAREDFFAHPDRSSTSQQD